MTRNTAFVRTGFSLSILAVALLAGNCGGGSGSRGDDTNPAPPNGNPEILMVIPNVVDFAGGQVVTVVAQDFQDDFTVNLPRIFVDNHRLPLNVIDSSSVEVMTPPHSVGAVDLVLRAAGTLETAILKNAIHYADYTAEIVLVSPEKGDIGGGEVIHVITSNFNDDFLVSPPDVFFGTVMASATSLDSTSVEVATPAHPAGRVDVTVVSGSETAILSGGFTFEAPAPPPPPPGQEILGVYPDYGLVSGGITVIIAVRGFNFSNPPLVLFGSKEATYVTNCSTSLYVINPRADQAGPVDVIVQSESSEQWAILENGFTYMD